MSVTPKRSVTRMASLISSPRSEMTSTSLRRLNMPSTYSSVLAEMNIISTEATMRSRFRLKPASR